MTDNGQELFPWVDESGKTIGKITREEAHCGSRLLHPVVHLHLFNNAGQLYLQHRPAWKDVQPNRWDTACGGHVDYGETVEQALRREVKEELGITDYTPHLLTHYVFDSIREREWVWVHTTIYDGAVHPSTTELAGGRFWDIEEIESSMGTGVFTPNFESEYTKYIAPLLCHDNSCSR